MIDDWDAQLLALLDNKPRYDAIRQSLNVFYHWLSTLNLRFLLITGIMHFQHKDVVDISLLPKFARLLGYTQSEFEFNFCDYIELAAQRSHMDVFLLLQQLNYNYCGFCFDEDASVKLYSPLDINSLFAQLHDSDKAPSFFSKFWLDAQGDSWMVRALIERALSGCLDLDDVEKIRTNLVVLDRQALINPPLFSDDALFPLLTLQGYLTLQAAVEPVASNPDARLFRCGCPNDLLTCELFVRFIRAKSCH